MKGAAGLGFFVTLAIVVIVFIIASQVHSHNQLTNSYQRLARRFQGRCNIVGLWNLPSVKFIHKDAYTLLDIASTGGKHRNHYTQLRIRWPDSRFRCEVYPAGVLSRFGKFLGMQDVEIGSPQFDADFVITGSDVHGLQEFLTLAVQERINQLRWLGQGYNSLGYYATDSAGGAGDIYISVSGGQLLVKKRGLIRDYDQLERFVLVALDLYDHAMQASAEGIEFVEPRPATALGLREAVCQICGEMVQLDPVFCRTCKTPHHRDCWEYYGACSTYGCGQRRYLVPRTH